MLDETKVVETNFKGNISLSNELIEKVVFKLVSYSSQYEVKSVRFQNIEGFSQKMFMVEMKKGQDSHFFGDVVVTYLKHLILLMNSNLNIFNFNVVLVFE